jgi:hypothetical protein
MNNVFFCPQHGHYLASQKAKHETLCHSITRPLYNAAGCLYHGCKSNAMDCDAFCAVHRAEFGLYMPQTYVQAYTKAKKAYEDTGEKHFVYRHKTIGHLHKGYGTARVTPRNEIAAIFSEVVFPNDGEVSTHTAQDLMFIVMHGDKNNSENLSENL